jgi:hypothetical protein
MDNDIPGANRRDRSANVAEPVRVERRVNLRSAMPQSAPGRDAHDFKCQFGAVLFADNLT